MYFATKEKKKSEAFHAPDFFKNVVSSLPLSIGRIYNREFLVKLFHGNCRRTCFCGCCCDNYQRQQPTPW